jgi:hypothetical protein
MLYYSAKPNASVELQPQNYAAMAQTLVEFCLGLWLLFGGRGLLRVLHWARTAGIPEPSNSTVETDARKSGARGSP